MKKLLVTALSILLLLAIFQNTCLTQELPEKYSEKLTVSHPIRIEQHLQLKQYIEKRINDSGRQADNFFQPDYSSIKNYETSTEKYREQLKKMIGYPPPGVVKNGRKRIEFVGEDKLCRIYRVWVEVLEGVESYGIYMAPRTIQEPAPIVICMHGGGGCPEFPCNFETPGNYGDMARRALRRGYVTWAPLALFDVRYAGDPPVPGADRTTIDRKAKLIGTSIAAIDIYKIIRGLEVIMELPETDQDRIGMIGLSYGGFYTLYTAALEPRINAAVSSCYFNDRTIVFGEKNQLADLQYLNLLNTFPDAQVVGLICPRPLIVEVGGKDKLFEIEGARTENERAQKYYQRLGISDRYLFAEHTGGHEFRGDEANDFLDKYLKR